MPGSVTLRFVMLLTDHFSVNPRGSRVWEVSLHSEGDRDLQRRIRIWM